MVMMVVVLLLLWRFATFTAAAVAAVGPLVVLVKRHVVFVLYDYLAGFPAAALTTTVRGRQTPGRRLLQLVAVTTTTAVLQLLVIVIIVNEITGFGEAIYIEYDIDFWLGRVDVVRHSVNSCCLLLRFLTPVLLMRLLFNMFLTAKQRSPSAR